MTFEEYLINISFSVTVVIILLSPEIVNYMIRKREDAKKYKKSTYNKSSFIQWYVTDLKIWEKSIIEVDELTDDN